MPSRREFELFLTLRGALGSDFSGSMRKAQSEFKALRSAMSTVNDKMRDVSEYQRLGNAMRDNETRLQKLQQRHRELQDEMLKTANPSEQLKRQLERNETQIQSLTDRMTEQRHELERLDDALRDAGVNTNNLTDETADLQRQYKELGDCKRNLENINIELDTNKAKLKDSVTELRNMATAYIGMGAAAYVATVKPAMAYESAFAGVLKTVDGTEKQLSTLRQDFIDMSQIDVIASAKEIAKVGEAGGQLGIYTENIADFSKTMIDLGESTNLSATEAAESFAKFANITKMPQTEFSRLGSVVVDLGNNMATTERDIVAMGTRLASTGELVGLSEAEIMGYAAALSSLGIEAEAGGTAASKMLKGMELAFSRGDMGDYAKAAGMTAEAFSELYQNNKLGAISAFTKGLNDVERNGKTAVQILDEMGINEVRLSNAVLALAASNDILTDATNIANNAWEKNTALSTEAEKRYQTTESRVQITKNAVENLGITLGDLATPFVRDLADDFTEAAMRAQRFVKENGEAIKDFAKGAVEVGGYLLALKGLKLTYLGAKSGALVVGKAISTFTTICATARTMTGGMSFKNLIKSFTSVTGVSIGAAGAIAGVTTAVIALGAAYVYLNKKHQESVKAIMDDALFNNGAKSLSEYVDEFKEATAASKKFADEIIATKEEHQKNAEQIKEVNGELARYADELNGLKDISPETAEALKQPFEDLSDALEADFDVTWNNIYDSFIAVGDKALADFGVDVAGMGDILDDFKKTHDANITESNKVIQSYLSKVDAGETVSQAEKDAFLNEVAYQRETAQIMNGGITLDSVKNKVAELSGFDYGANKEVGIQKLGEFRDYMAEYTSALTESYKTLQSDFEMSKSLLAKDFEYGRLDREDYEAKINAINELSALQKIYLEEEIQEAEGIYENLRQNVDKQIEGAARAAFNESGPSPEAVWENFFTNGGLFAKGEDLYNLQIRKNIDEYKDLKAAVEEVGSAIAKTPELSLDAQPFYDELKRVKAARSELGDITVTATGGSGGVIVTASDVDGYASGTEYARSGLKLVGENGPELLQFRGGERVYNARETADILAAYKQMNNSLPWVNAAVAAPSAPSTSHSVSNNYHITVNPTFYGDSGDGDINDYSARMADIIIQRLDERERDMRRNAYY